MIAFPSMASHFRFENLTWDQPLNLFHRYSLCHLGVWCSVNCWRWGESRAGTKEKKESIPVHRSLCVRHKVWEGTPQTRNLFIKVCVFILTRLNFSHYQSTLHLIQYTYQDIFSTAQNSFWACWFWCLLVLLSFFVLSLPHWQNVSL